MGEGSNNEEIVGGALAPFRGKVQIATKFGVRHIGTSLVCDSRAETIRASVEGSLRRLNVERIALAWMLGKKPYIVPIPGTTKLARMKENAQAAEIQLTEKEIQNLDAALGSMKMSDVFGGHTCREK